MPSPTLVNSYRKTHKNISKQIVSIARCPDYFLSVNELKLNEIKSFLQNVYKLTNCKDAENKSNAELIQELILEGLDVEQVWQLLELRNMAVLPQFVKNTSNLISYKENKFKICYAGTRDSEHNEVDHAQERKVGTFDDPDDKISNSTAAMQVQKPNAKKVKSSVVDDDFFKLSEMEAFLVAEDKKEMNKQNGKLTDNEFAIDYFAYNFEEDSGSNVGYKDFFDEESESMIPQQGLSGDEDEYPDNISELDDEDEAKKSSDGESNNYATEEQNGTENEVPIKSSFEERQARLNEKIKNYEGEILGEKPWQLKGEIQATNRPQNSLLAEILEFEATNRPAPIITEETTLRLEDIIKLRIKDQSWDDVETKVKPLTAPQEYRKQLTLDQEKSKESLAQIYEKEYQNEVIKLSSNTDVEEESALQKEIKNMMQLVFVKLDALSNFHFTPKPVALEPKIITNTAAVNMEEVAPIAVSNAKLLAPEEIRNRAKGDVIGINERTKTDKNRNRRHKKQKQKAIYNALEKRDVKIKKHGLNASTKMEQAKAMKDLTKHRNVEKLSISKDNNALKSSKAFFSKLQETTAATNISSKKRKQNGLHSLSAKKLKL